MFRTLAFVAASWIAVGSTVASAAEPTYTCYCEEECGNGGLGANAGNVVPGAQSATLRSYFGLQRSGYSAATGWTCLRESARYSCQEDSLTPRQALVRFGSDAPDACALSGAEAPSDRAPARSPKRAAGR